MQALHLTTTSGSTNPTPSLTLTSLPIPSLPPDSVLVKVRAAGINPSDVLNAHGGFPSTTYPRIPGRDYAGVVTDAPAEYIGQEVYGTSGDALGFTTDGTHAEYYVVPCNSIAKKPSNLDFAQAATVGVPFTTAALTLHRAMLRSTDTVLVIDATGAVGSAVCQLARNQGCRVLGAARRDTADVNLVSDPQLKTARNLTDGKGPDVVIDTVGTPDLMKAAVMCLAPRGRFIFITAPKAGSTEVTIDMKYVYRNEIALVGCNSLLSTMVETARDLEEMREGFENGTLTTARETDLKKVGIDDAVEAYEQMGRGKGKNFVIVF